MASVPEQLAAEVFAIVNAESPISSGFGRRELSTNSGPPKVVVVPLGAPSITQPDQPGFRRITTNSGARCLLLRRFDLFFSIHEKTFELTEDLYLRTLLAVRRVAHHSVAFSQETWIEQQDGEDGFIRYGTVITFVATIDIPVFDEVKQLVTVTNFETECEV